MRDRKTQKDTKEERPVSTLLSALEFYANVENWKEQESGIGMFPGEAVDYGARAEEALSEYRRATS